jgi:hypothetical protein
LPNEFYCDLPDRQPSVLQGMAPPFTKRSSPKDNSILLGVLDSCRNDAINALATQTRDKTRENVTMQSRPNKQYYDY